MNFFTITSVKKYQFKIVFFKLCNIFFILFLTIQELKAFTVYKEVETYFEYEGKNQHLSISQRIELENLSKQVLNNNNIFLTIQSFCNGYYDKTLIEKANRRAEEIKMIFIKNGIENDRISIEIITSDKKKKNKIFIIRERIV